MMSENKIEFRIVKDTSGKHIDLKSMSIGAARSMVVILQSLTNILNEVGDGRNVKIKISKGSAAIAALGPENVIKKVQTGFNEVAENRCTNKQLVEHWLSIQSLIKSNGLEYDANFYTKSGKTSLVDTIKNSKKFRVKSKRRRVGKDTDLIFLSGKLIEIGGKNPNIHIIADNEEKYTIACNEDEAIKVNKFLYKQLDLSVWRTKKTNGIITYLFCDFYINEKTFDLLKVFLDQFNNEDDVKSLLVLHDQLRDFIKAGDLGNLRKFLRLFQHECLDASTLKTILIGTKAIKEKEEISELRSSIKEILEGKIGSLV